MSELKELTRRDFVEDNTRMKEIGIIFDLVYPNPPVTSASGENNLAANYNDEEKKPCKNNQLL